MIKLFNAIFGISVSLYIVLLTIKMSFFNELVSTNQTLVALAGIILIVGDNILNEIKDNKDGQD